MVRGRFFGASPDSHPWMHLLFAGLAMSLIAIDPAPLVPIARVYAALCERYPLLALVSNHAPPLPLALLFILIGASLLVGGWSGVIGLLATLRVNRQLRLGGQPVPPRVVSIAHDLGLAPWMTYVPRLEPMACCYGFLRPRIAVTSGLIERLDDEELTAVLGHEREHLRRRDPLRYLVLGMVTSAAFMFPIAPTLRQRWTAQAELTADRAALAITSRRALAGALLAVVPTPRIPSGIAGLTPTEARIAQLTGVSALPPIPAQVVVASLGIVGVVALAMADLASSAHVVRVVWPFCSWLP